MAKLDALPILSVAIVNGYAFGGGLELALACSFRLATRNAKMALPEIKLGLIPGYGGTQRLPRLVGESRALDLILSGRAVDADEALRIGLVDRIIDGDPVAAGIAFARTMTQHSLPVLGFARDAVRSASEVPLADGLKIEGAAFDLGRLPHARVTPMKGSPPSSRSAKPGSRIADLDGRPKRSRPARSGPSRCTAPGGAPAARQRARAGGRPHRAGRARLRPQRRIPVAECRRDQRAGPQRHVRA